MRRHASWWRRRAQERLNIDDDEVTDHFENIQSTNWQTVSDGLMPR